MAQSRQMNVEVRYHDITFAPSDIRRYVGGSTGSRRLSWPETVPLVRGRTRRGTFAFGPYLMAVLAPEFHFGADGLYLSGMPPHGVVASSYVREHGRFMSEGLNNHVHLPIFTKSRVAQFEIGVRAIRQWSLAIAALSKRPRQTTIYLTGPTHFTLCVYSDAPVDETESLERRLGGNLVRASVADFNSWASMEGE